MKLFQIHEADLEVLERELPALVEVSMIGAGSESDMTRKRWEAVKSIVSNVRWNYGPPLQIKELTADEGNDL